MYSFEPSEEQKMLVEALARYASTDLRPKMRESDEESRLPASIIKKGWELGFLQASIPEIYGGFGERSAVTGVLAAEELAWGDLAGALAVLTPGLFSLPVLLAGSEEQKQKYIAPVIEGNWQPYTAALIEPSFDFDPLELKTTAVEENGEYVLNGEKVYVPYANQSVGMIVYANLGGTTQGFIVDTGAVGMSVGERQKLLGVKALEVYPVKLDNVRIAKSFRLGGENGHDFSPLLAGFHLANAGLAVGMSRAAYEYARDYAKEREAFGVKIAQKQAIAFMLAEMATEIEAIRLLVWEAAWKLDQGDEQAAGCAYLAHQGAADMAMMVTDRAVQILGGHGYIREHPVELWMRNGRGFATFTGMALI